MSSRLRSSASRISATAIAVALIGVPVAAEAKPEPLNPWWFSALHMAENHQQTTGKGVTVAVIDSALDPTVPELKGADINFGRACDPRKQTKPLIASKYADHGTAMATIIAGQGTGNAAGGAGITGIAPDVKVNFYSYDPDPSSEKDSCSPSHLPSLFTQAADDGADIISVSVIGMNEVSIEIEELVARGVVVVAGAGAAKDRNFGFPAALPGVVSVLAVDAKGRAWKDNPGWGDSKNTDGYPVISAPGVDVPVGGMTGSRWITGEERTGTSDATPMVAGMLALVKSKYPKATGNQLIQHLIHYSGRQNYSWDKNVGFGIASATQMLKHDPTEWPEVNPLLGEPEDALKDFPMSIRGADKKATSDPKAATDAESGVPTWIWVTGTAALLIAAAALALAIRRKSTRASSDTAEGARP